jgi:cell division protein FtsI (penicillin-binding protein 3)
MRVGSAPRAQFAGRVKLVFAVFMAGFAAVIGRAAQLQIVQHTHLLRLAEEQYLGNVKVLARRGIIYDRTHTPLAISVDVPSVFANPRQVRDPQATAQALSALLGTPRAELQARLTSGRYFVWLKRQLEPQVAKAVEALQLPGIGLSKEPRRFYPNREIGAHVVGFAGLDARGLEGVEKTFDAALLGEQQSVQAVRDARGNAVLQGGLDPDNKATGDNLILTLDLQLQHSAQAAVLQAMQKTQAKGATAVVLDVATAEVLAMAVVPAFNPNQSGPQASLRRNRLVTDLFEPGSTLKPYVVAAGLDSGALTAQSTFFCENGRYKIGRRFINDTSPHGWMGLTEILARSSNIGMAKIAAAMGKEGLEESLRRVGLGSRTGIELPGEVPGLLRSCNHWSELETATIAFGQGMAVNGLQLAAVYRALAAGGLYRAPRLLQAVEHSDGTPGSSPVAAAPSVERRVLSAGATAKVVRMMEASVQPHEGTGRLAAVPGYRVAGKTGTAQKADPISGGYSRDAYIALFAGFLPAQDPKVVVVVAVDEPRSSHFGGVVAAPVFAQIALAAMQRLGVPATEPTGLAGAAPIDFVSSGAAPAPGGEMAETADSPTEALARADPAGLNPSAPPAVAHLPSFVGLTARQVVERWSRLAPAHCAAWDIALEGTGRVVKQDPPAGLALLPPRAQRDGPLDDLAQAAPLRRLRLTLAPP